MTINFTDLSQGKVKRADELTKRIGKGAPQKLDVMTVVYLLGFIQGLSINASLTISCDLESATVVLADGHGERTLTGVDLAGALLALDMGNEACTTGEVS